MKSHVKFFVVLLSALFLFAGNAYGGWGGNPCNPCGKKKNVCNPCNPCSKMSKSYSALVKKGKKLWNNKKLGNSGVSCMSCHADHENLNLDKVGTFPHYVAMPDKVVTLDQMINYCMITPMEAKALPWDSIKMTALASYYQEYIKSYRGAKNACNPCNPCGKKKNACNPCNPCGK